MWWWFAFQNNSIKQGFGVQRMWINKISATELFIFAADIYIFVQGY